MPMMKPSAAAARARGHHLIIRSVLTSQTDIFHNGAVEQDGVLGNEGDIFAHIVQGSVPHIHATTRRVPELTS